MTKNIILTVILILAFKVIDHFLRSVMPYSIILSLIIACFIAYLVHRYMISKERINNENQLDDKNN